MDSRLGRVSASWLGSRRYAKNPQKTTKQNKQKKAIDKHLFFKGSVLYWNVTLWHIQMPNSQGCLRIAILNCSFEKIATKKRAQIQIHFCIMAKLKQCINKCVQKMPKGCFAINTENELHLILRKRCLWENGYRSSYGLAKTKCDCHLLADVKDIIIWWTGRLRYSCRCW